MTVFYKKNTHVHNVHLRPASSDVNGEPNKNPRTRLPIGQSTKRVFHQRIRVTLTGSLTCVMKVDTHTHTHTRFPLKWYEPNPQTQTRAFSREWASASSLCDSGGSAIRGVRGAEMGIFSGGLSLCAVVSAVSDSVNTRRGYHIRNCLLSLFFEKAHR